MILMEKRAQAWMAYLHATLLKIFAAMIAQPVTRLINSFISTQTWPIEWKSCNLYFTTSSQKEITKQIKINYRPISIFSALSKSNV